MTPRLDICTGPVMDPQCGVMECPDGREPTEEDCDRCMASYEDDIDHELDSIFRFIREQAVIRRSKGAQV